YNGENFVAEAIQCVLSQTFRDWELVISDNASTDRTVEICREFAVSDDRIRVHNSSRTWDLLPISIRPFGCRVADTSSGSRMTTSSAPSFWKVASRSWKGTIVRCWYFQN